MADGRELELGFLDTDRDGCFDGTEDCRAEDMAAVDCRGEETLIARHLVPMDLPLQSEVTVELDIPGLVLGAIEARAIVGVGTASGDRFSNVEGGALLDFALRITPSIEGPRFLEGRTLLHGADGSVISERPTRVYVGCCILVI